jgi:SAM-dependent methyltransferase
VPSPSGYGYFDEAYFEHGHLRGTAYSDYLRSARRSPTYAELAERIAHVFQPKRTLEVGCATGIVVKHLNDRGCEAFGVDVSDWAIEHREHPNVVHAGAEALPFEDGSFDLVFSVHALEHIPAHLEHRALAELDRVAAEGSRQFHLMPIVGRGPYVGAAAIDGLRKDPTHNLLRTFDEWLYAWATHGWHDSGLVILIRNDTESFELSSCQYLLTRTSVPADVVARVRESNIDAARMLFMDAKTRADEHPSIPIDALSGAGLDGPALLRFEGQTWTDVSSELEPPLSLEDSVLHLTTVLTADETQRLRLALVDGHRESFSGEYRNVSERWFEVPKGLSRIRAEIGTFVELRGSLDLAGVRGVFFGGQAESCSVQVRIDVERNGVETRIL